MKRGILNAKKGRSIGDGRDTSAPTASPFNLFKFIIVRLQVQASEGYPFLIVGALAASGAFSLETFGKGHVSHDCHMYWLMK
jgi:hypothetical protein